MSDLSRYIKAQERTHASALGELKNGYKSSHWSWWEIPQIIGLGMTSTSKEYAIRDLNEAKEYLADDILRTHLLELCEALLSLKTNDAEYVMGYPDDLKLRSCMTLFQAAEEERARTASASSSRTAHEMEGGTFQAVLDKFFDGKPDERTLQILKDQTN